MIAGRAFANGIWMVVRAPILLAGVLVITIGTAVPFGLVLNSRLQAALDEQQPISRGSGDIDPEWWLEFREHARGLEATFTPTVIGFAAPLDNLSSLLDATPRPLALAGPVALSALAWAFLWGALIHRFSQGRAIRFGEFLSAGWRYLPRLLAISVIIGIVNLLLYFTVHAALFGPVFQALSGLVATERSAFAIRVALYLLFGAVVLPVSLVADYARIHLVTGCVTTVGGSLASGQRFVRRHLASVVSLAIFVGLLFATLLVAYGAIDTFGGTRVGGWRGIAIGQAYIVARLGLRLTFTAAEVRLFQLLAARSFP
ncbi:MAG: hypothetical protein ABI665_25125 [Vicinamibacterales bacterium]